MYNEHQDKINSILEQVSKGEYSVQPFGERSKNCSEEHRECLRHSLLTLGQIHPILVTIKDLETEQPIVEIVKGNTRWEIINELRQEELLKFTPFFEVKDAEDAEAIYAATTFVKKDYNKFQKAFYGVVYLYDWIEAKAYANQCGVLNVNKPIDTCKDVGKLCESNEKYVRLVRNLLELDMWFYTYVYEENNNMSPIDATALLRDVPAKQREVVAKMKELHTNDKAAELKRKSKKAKLVSEAEGDDTPNEDITLSNEDIVYFTAEFIKENKSLYKRALAKLNYADPEVKRKNAKDKLKSNLGGKLPDESEIGSCFSGEDKYVNEYGNGPDVIEVSFRLPETLAEIIAENCKRHGYNVTIYSSFVEKEAA